MQRQEASRQINKLIKVTHNEIGLAKSFILEYCRSNSRQRLKTSSALKKFVSENGLTEPQTIIYSPNEDTESKLAEAARYFIYYIACFEAILSLIHSDILFSSGSYNEWKPSLEYQHNGNKGGISFDDCYEIQYPHMIWLAPQYQNESGAILTDPGLYVLTLGIEGADEEVLDAVKDAIMCFRGSLFRPALTMLGKAMEGAWIELGLSLANAIYKSDENKRAKFVSAMQGIIPSSQKMKKVIELYKNKTLSGKIIADSEIQPSELDYIVNWSDILRDARNAIHFGVKPTFPNNYEKTATMLLGAAKNIPEIYHIKRVCDGI